MRLIHEEHRDFFDQVAGPDFETLDFSFPIRRDVRDLDPTADMLPAPEDTPAGTAAKSAATAYFHGRRIELIHVTGYDAGGCMGFAFHIALDPKPGHFAGRLLACILELSLGGR